MSTRIKIGADGSFRLPQEMLDRLGWKTGAYLEVSEAEGGVHLQKIEVDLFAEAMKTPEPDAFEKILEKQKKSQADAFKSFEERMKDKDLPEARPEDRPDFWR